MEQFIPFQPDLGADSRQYFRLLRAAEAGVVSLHDAVAISLGEVADSKAKFALSVLNDILQAGGTAIARDSRLYVAWPDWVGDVGRQNARRALESARGQAPLSDEAARRLAPLFCGPLDGPQVAQIVAEGSFQLRSVNEVHPSGLQYSEAFSAALRYWSMPYRGRTGRMKRFVFTVLHHLLPGPCVVGILELGDEAPFCNWRDDLIGLSGLALDQWLLTDPKRRAHLGEERLRGIRSALLPLGDGEDLSHVPADEVVSRANHLEMQSRGRSKVRVGEERELRHRKRAIYALRLASGEVGLRRVQESGRVSSPDRKLLARGLRALHDLLVPRYHMEVTVCGALPPFSDALVGKLLVAHFAHPDVVSAVVTPPGELLAWSFDLDRLAPHVSSEGMLAVTTKGLYSHHAPLYHRGTVPGVSSPLRLHRIAMTEGTTTTLLSSDTARLARTVLESGALLGQASKVSQVYGSGGAKRHRSIEAAAVASRISKDLINAGIRRPVYGVSFVSNAVNVAWEAAEPRWLIPRDVNPEQYSAAATDMWRSRWLERSVRRIQDFAFCPPFPRILTSPTGEPDDQRL